MMREKLEDFQFHIQFETPESWTLLDFTGDPELEIATPIETKEKHESNYNKKKISLNVIYIRQTQKDFLLQQILFWHFHIFIHKMY